MKVSNIFFATLMFFAFSIVNAQTYKIAGTGQEKCYDNNKVIASPLQGAAFYGQDAQHKGNAPSYTDNLDGTITDNVTGLIWTKTLDLNKDGVINYQDKLSYSNAIEYAKTLDIGGFDDWRVPAIKELYSLIVFTGEDPSGFDGTDTETLVPFINTDYFEFAYGDLSANERIIDAQMATTNIYVGKAMNSNTVMFGVNFADGRIKGYPTSPMPGQTQEKGFYAYFVRSNNQYGINDFQDNNDGTVSDLATGLMWTKDDNGEGVNWESALAYAEQKNSEKSMGYSDWRLPNVKELQSIVDYTRSPQTTQSAAIDPKFNCTQINDEGGNANYPFYWSSTTHANMKTGANAAYVCFGEALGFMQEPPNSGNYTLMDVHGAGAQRSDPKTGDPADYPNGHGPQGDVIRIYNYVRLVRDAGVTGVNELNNNFNFEIVPNPAGDFCNLSAQGNQSINRIDIYSLLGELTASYSGGLSNNNVLNLSNLEAGMYFVVVHTENMTFSKPLIVSK